MARTSRDKSKGLFHVGHGLGVEMPVGTTIAQMVKAAGLDFKVEKVPMMAVLSADEAVEVPARFATVRTDTSKVLGVVGAGYQIAQNEISWTIPTILEAEGKFEVQSAAAFKGGSHVMLTGKVADSVIRQQDGTEDRISQILCFSNAHTSKKALVMGFWHHRHFCGNQNVAMMKGLASQHRILHRSNLEIRVAEANEAMLVAEDALAKGRQLFQEMADAKMTRKQFEIFARDLLNAVNGSHAEDATREAKHSEEARAAQIKELTTLFGEGRGNKGCSLWDGYNAVTEWLDHRLDKFEASKLTAQKIGSFTADTYFGRSRRIKERAVRMLVRR